MIFGSVCSGIEAASVAWEPLGMVPAWFAEIDPFCSAVLAHHWPHVPNLGDFTKIGEDRGPIDVLVGGTPCQSFSVAGDRGGLDDERGNLALEFLSLARRLRPRWIVWENVPGVLSSIDNDAPPETAQGLHVGVEGERLEVDVEFEVVERHAFHCFLAGLGECGYHVAYRVLDAQGFGVPQKRRRVFVVGHLGDWRPAAAVLFEPGCLSRDTEARREKRQDVAGSVTARAGERGGSVGTDEAAYGHLQAVGPLRVAGTHSGFTAADHGHVVPVAYQCGGSVGPMGCVRGGNGHASAGVPFVADAITANYAKNGGRSAGKDSDLRNVVVSTGETSHCLNAGGMGRQDYETETLVSVASAVRRLTPRECERLQGFPDDHTLIRTWSGWRYVGDDEDPQQLAASGFKVKRTKKGRWRVNDPDGPRYRAIGNSIAVPVLRWIGERMMAVDNILKESAHG